MERKKSDSEAGGNTYKVQQLCKYCCYGFNTSFTGREAYDAHWSGRMSFRGCGQDTVPMGGRKHVMPSVGGRCM